jgi:hypothetical protein
MDAMFNKRQDKADASALAQRIRTISRKPAEDETAYVDTRIRASSKRPPRNPVFRHGSLQLPTGLKIQIVMKDVSSGGARVEFFERIELPGSVLLIEPTMKIRRWCRVVWQRDGVVGLQFTE